MAGTTNGGGSGRPLPSDEEIHAVVLAHCRAHGCDCEPDVWARSWDGVLELDVIHGDDCPLLDTEDGA